MGHQQGNALRLLSIRQRLVLAFGLFTLLLAAVAGLGAWRLAQLSAMAHEITAVNVVVERLIGQWLAETKSNVVRSFVLTQSDDPQLRRMLAPAFEAAAPNIDALAARVEPLLATIQARELFAQVAKARKAYVDVRKSIVERRKAGEENATLSSEAELAAAGQRYVAAVEALRDYYDADAEHDAREVAANASSGRRLLLGSCAGGLALAVAAAWLITRSIVRPLDEAVAAVGRVADGDLTGEVRVSGSDELTRLSAGIATMNANLRALVEQVVAGARSVAGTSAQIAGGNSELSHRTEEQASMLQETATSMEQLTATVSQNAQTAASASTLAGDARLLAQDGGDAVALVVNTMAAIATSSERISEITGLIDGIAFQTNILALNAAVEAARAGSQGRGFAVVAAEVRTLAQRSAEAAREIKALLAASANEVDTGTVQAGAAGRKMGEIVEAIVKVSTLFAELAAASAEQSAGIEQINTAVVQMDHVVQENAALVEEAAAATGALSGNASALLEVVNRFRIEAEPARGDDDAAAGPSWSVEPPLPRLA